MVIATGQQSPVNFNTIKHEAIDLDDVLNIKYKDTTDIHFTVGHNDEVDIDRPSKNDSLLYKGQEFDLVQFHCTKAANILLTVKQDRWNCTWYTLPIQVYP